MKTDKVPVLTEHPFKWKTQTIGEKINRKISKSKMCSAETINGVMCYG